MAPFSYSEIGKDIGEFGGEFIPIPGGKLMGKYGGQGIGALMDYYMGQNPTTAQSMQQRPGQQPGVNLPEQQGNWFSGYQGAAGQFPRFMPNQLEALNFFLQQGMQNADFGNIESLARRNFQTKTIPSLAERFAGTSAGPAGSSRFRGALGAAGSELESTLAALRSQYGLQQAKLGLQPTFENVYIPGQPGAAGSFAQYGLPAMISAFPAFLEWWSKNKGEAEPQKAGA